MPAPSLLEKEFRPSEQFLVDLFHIKCSVPILCTVWELGLPSDKVKGQVPVPEHTKDKVKGQVPVPEPTEDKVKGQVPVPEPTKDEVKWHTTTKDGIEWHVPARTK